MKKNTHIFVLLAIICIYLISGIAYAAEDVKVMETYTIDDRVKVYVRNASVQDAQFQIGNIPADTPTSYSISTDEAAARTLIMLDNSISIPKNSRPKIIETINAIVDAHADKEEFRIATFAENINYLSDMYSQDYTALHNMIDNISFNDQDTMLTDALQSVLEDYRSEQYSGYRRIVIITDGVNNKPVGGVSLDQIKEMLKETPYPIYTIGCDTGKNDDLLDNLFSLSWNTGCEYKVLENTEVSDITAMTSADNNITVFETTIPEEAKTGGRQSCKLTLGDGTELVCEADIPFSIKEETEPVAPVIVVEEPEPADDEPDETEEIEEEITPEPERPPLYLLIAVGAGAAVLAAGIVGAIIHAKRKKARLAAMLESNRDDQYEKTVYLGSDNRNDSSTMQLTPGEKKQRYRITMTDCNDPARSFRCEITDEIMIGRKPDNNIVISDDTTVHGQHCTIKVDNGIFYITDLKNVKNSTSVNGVPLKPEVKQLIVNNTKVDLGRHRYTVNISEV